MNETLITVVGNISSDVMSRRTAEGAKVVSFRVTSNERKFDRVAQDWVDGQRFTVTVSCWRSLASGAAASLAKGDPVVVHGRLYTRVQDLEDGGKRYFTELDARAVGPNLSRCTADVRRNTADPVVVHEQEDADTPDREQEPVVVAA